MYNLLKPLAFASLIFLTGCNGLYSASKGIFQSAGFGPGSECSDVLRFYDAISGLKYKRLKAIKTRLTAYQTFSGCIQLKLAVLESMPRSPLQNTAESTRLLRDYIKKQRYSSEDERDFARILLAHILQTRRFLARQKSLKQNVGDTKKQSEQMEQLSEENEDLNEKLDQLKEIEQDITQKEQSVINPSGEGDKP